MSQESDFLHLLSGELSEEDRLYSLCTQIENIVSSYDDIWDALAEMVQNAVDAVLARAETELAAPAGQINVHVDAALNRISVTDNGLGVAQEDFVSVFRPNYSVKRRLGHKSARGEKGAGVVFLQFGHDVFEFQTRRPDFQATYRLDAGNAWFKNTLNVVQSDVSWSEKLATLPTDPHTIQDAVDATVPCPGSRVSVDLGPGSNLPQLSRYFSDPANCLRRLEHVVRTRTALGMFAPDGDLSLSESPAARQLLFDLHVTLPNGSAETKTGLAPGFDYPHLEASRKGRANSLMTAPVNGSELLYEFFDFKWIKKYLTLSPQLVAVAQKYDLQGYFSYAYNNPFYEELIGDALGVDPSTADGEQLMYELQQVNGGFHIAVREYPNGRRHAFLHRGGSEDKSRTYCLFNFRGGYKPDYGRKNIAEEVRPLILELCKQLMSWTTRKERKERLRTGKGATPHGAQDLEAARKKLKVDATALSSVGPLIVGAAAPSDWEREPRSETEVIAAFMKLILDGRLPGMTLFGTHDSTMLDGLFSYHLDADPVFAYNKSTCPLGVVFIEGQEKHLDQGWLEFKYSSDLLCGDINKKAGEPGKKWFSLIDLLVCEKVDDAVEGFEFIAVEEATVPERRFFGVTHLMRSSSNNEHVIQVIELGGLRGPKA